MDGKGEETRNTVLAGIPPALPPLLYLPPAFWSSQSLRGLCRSPSSQARRAPNNSKEEEWMPSQASCMVALRTQPCRWSSDLEVLTEPSSALPPQYGGCLWPKSPGSSPSSQARALPRVVRGAEASVRRDKGRSCQQAGAGDSGGVSGPGRKGQSLSPRASPRYAKSMSHPSPYSGLTAYVTAHSPDEEN